MLGCWVEAAMPDGIEDGRVHRGSEFSVKGEASHVKNLKPKKGLKILSPSPYSDSQACEALTWSFSAKNGPLASSHVPPLDSACAFRPPSRAPASHANLWACTAVHRLQCDFATTARRNPPPDRNPETLKTLQSPRRTTKSISPLKPRTPKP